MPSQSYNIAFTPTGASRVNNNAKEIETSIKKVNASLIVMRTRLESILGVEILDTFRDKWDGIKHYSMMAGNKIKMVFSRMFLPFKTGIGAFRNMRATGMSVFSSLSMGAKAFGMSSKVVFSMAKKAMLGFASTAFTVLAPIAALIAIGYIFKKMWQANIGGIATRLYKVIGKMKSWWGKFNASVIKTLRKLTPFFNVVFNAIGSAFKSILSPIVSVFKYIGKQFKGVFGTGKGSMKALMVYGKMLAVSFKVLGKVIGFVLKVAFIPLKIIIWNIATSIKVLQKLFKWFKNSKAFEPTISALKSVGNFFIKIKDGMIGIVNTILKAIKTLLDKIPEPIKKAIGLGGVEMDLSESPATMANQVSNKYNKTTNNNQQIVFHTGRATTPDQSQQFAELLKQQLAGDM